MTVHTTYFGGLGQYEPTEDAAVIGVVRYPKPFVGRVTDRNIPAVAPPEDLLDAYKRVEEAAEADGTAYPSAVAWESVAFERRYREHLTTPGPERVLEELRERALERDLWLVCWEKDCRWCHRRLLADEIVADLEDVDVVHHPDPSTLDESDDPDDGEERVATLADFGTPEA